MGYQLVVLATFSVRSVRTEIKCVFIQRSNECTYRDQMNAQINKWSERGVVDRKGGM